MPSSHQRHWQTKNRSVGGSLLYTLAKLAICPLYHSLWLLHVVPIGELSYSKVSTGQYLWEIATRFCMIWEPLDLLLLAIL